MGASWVHQKILRKHPTTPLQVYAIWMPMLPTDARREWDPQLLDDPRVLHFWDDRRIAGEQFGKEVGRPVEWDAYFLYDRGASWGDDLSKLVGSGRTVIGRSGE